MKKQMSVFAMLVLAVVALAGCPSINPQDADTGIDAAEAVALDTAAASVTIPSGTDANPFLGTDNPYAGGIDIPVGMGAVTVNGSFYDAKSLEKSISLNDVVEFYKGQATVMQFSFTPMSSAGVGKSEISAKGSGSGGLDFRIPVVDGKYAGRFFLTPDDYSVGVWVIDTQGYTLFSADSEVSVIAGQNCHFDVVLYLNEMRYFNFKIPELPGTYSNSGSARIVADDGQGGKVVYVVYYYLSCYDCGKGAATAEKLVFYTYLPVDFDGETSNAIMFLNDANGDPRAAEINFNVFDTANADVNGVFEVDYTISPYEIGEVDPDISFAEYPEEAGKG